MKIKISLIGILILFTSMVNADSRNSSAKYQVGSWTIDISPKPEEGLASCLGGFGGPFARCGSTETLDAITVRSISIADADTNVIFTVIDSIGIGDSVIADIKALASDLTDGQIEEDSIQVVATHTHAGPDLQGLWGGISAAYKNRIIKQAALSIVLANYTAVKARVSALLVEDGARVSNRRGWPDVDTDVGVLDFKAVKSGERIATLVNMSAHPTILGADNFGYSSGYIHFVRKKLERRLGGNAIFINGRLGDASPVTKGPRSYQEAGRYGRGIARRIIRNIDHAKILRGDLTFDSFAFSHPITNLPVIGAVQAGLFDLEIDENFNINTQFSLLRFGDDLTSILFPGEILTRLAEPIIDAIDSDFKFFFGLTDDSLGYFIPSDEFLQIPGRDTEEIASMDINAGDAIQAAILAELER